MMNNDKGCQKFHVLESIMNLIYAMGYGGLDGLDQKVYLND